MPQNQFFLKHDFYSADFSCILTIMIFKRGLYHPNITKVVFFWPLFYIPLFYDTANSQAASVKFLIYKTLLPLQKNIAITMNWSTVITDLIRKVKKPQSIKLLKEMKGNSLVHKCKPYRSICHSTGPETNMENERKTGW